MGYKVDYDKLNSMFEAINQQNTIWSEQLGDIQTAIQRLKNSVNMSGTGADAIRGYMTYVHGVLLSNLMQLTELHRSNFVSYKTDYQQNVDTGLDTVIDEDELGQIIDTLDAMKRAAVVVDDNVRDRLFVVRSYFSPSLRSIYGVTAALDQVRNICVTLDEAVKLTENTHFQNDFSLTEAMINQLTADINAYLGNSREFMATFNPSDPANVNTYNRLAAMCNVALLDVAAKEAAVNAAIEYHDSREELEKRLEVAKWEKLIVTGAVVVLSAVVLVALPVSGPLVVGAVSGLSSFVITANNTAMDLYAVDGDLSKDDFDQVMLDASKSAVTGFVTGVVGGCAGKALSGLTHGIPALQSSNSLVNTATHVVIGSSTEVATGIVTRTASELVDQVMDEEKGIDWTEVAEEAFDGREMVKDGVLGGIGGYMDGHKVDYKESMHSDYEQGTLNEMRESGEWDAMEAYNDTGASSTAIYSDSEQAIINEMHTSGEWDAMDGLDEEYFDPNTKTYTELNYDMTPKTEKAFVDHLADYTIKKDDGELSLDGLFSSDDYSHQKYDTAMDTNEALKKSYSILDKAGVLDDYKVVARDETLYSAKEKKQSN